jgi:hypothetical protein
MYRDVKRKCRFPADWWGELLPGFSARLLNRGSSLAQEEALHRLRQVR